MSHYNIFTRNNDNVVIGTLTAEKFKNNDKIRTNESTTIATFVLHPNVIQAIKDKSPDDEHFDNVRHFYFGENQFGCVNQYANGF
ncbi:5701_t:CDS:2 [Entrophospora sp. SA101]|nr:5701_t:CDS:2 [Entrophospora sp. SA101]